MWMTVRSTLVCAALAWHPDAVSFDVIGYQLGCAEAPGDSDIVIVAPQEQVFTEEEVLYCTVSGNCIGEAGAQHPPGLACFAPRLNLFGLGQFPRSAGVSR